MGSREALHNKFLNNPTTGLTVLGIVDESFQTNPLKFIQEFTDIYNDEVKEDNASKELHNAFRTLLCYEYQLKFERKVEHSVVYSQKNLLNNLRKSFHSFNDDESIRLILSDITILQIILYLDYSQIYLLLKELIENTKESSEGQKLQDNLQNFENLVSALNLKKNLLKDDNSSGTATLQQIQTLLLKEINLWFQIVDENNPQEWRPFILLLLSILSAFESPEVFQCLWELIAQCDANKDDNKTQTLLCGIINDLFSKASEEMISINLKFCMNQNILLLISHHLKSNIQLCRKQAQYILRSIVDYLKRFPQYLQFTNNNELNPPFVCCADKNSNIKEVEDNFFLLLESLEEKQAHLIIPALSHLKNLVSASIDHKSCGNCFHETWLNCIFNRLLYHDNNIVIKNGLIQLLRMDPHILNDNFVRFITEALRYTFLYDEQGTDGQPQIQKEISEFFAKSEMSHTDFIKKFLVSASLVPWPPIPLFYIFEALRNNEVNIVYNTWDKEELEALRIIADKYLKLQTKLIRVATEMNILTCINTYVVGPVDLFALMKIFAVFPDQELLQRGTESWDLIITYFIRNFPSSDAVMFVSRQCDQLLRNETDNSMINSLGILIVLLFDAQKILRRNSCPCLKALCNLFNSLVGVDKRPYADLSLCYRAMKIITSLLNLSPEPEEMHFKVASTYIEHILHLILKTLKSKVPQSHDEANIYVEVLSAIVNVKESLPDGTRILHNFVNKLQDKEAMRALGDISCDNRPVFYFWYALNVIYFCNECSGNAERIPYKIPPYFTVNNSNGKIISECYGLLAKIQHQFIKFTKLMDENDYKTFIITEIEPLSEIKSDHTIQSIAGTLQLIIERIKNSEIMKDSTEVIKNIINTCWKTLWDMNRTPEFWKSYRKLIQLIIDKNFLQKDEFKEITLNYVEEILSKTENALGLRYILFSEMSSLEGEDIFIFHEAILSSMLYTDAGKINKRIELQTCCYITKHHSIDLLWEAGAYSDAMIRAKLVKLIIKIISKNSKELGNAYVAKLTSMLEKYKNKRYFGDSNLHRVKHRIMQILLLLQPHLDEINLKKLHDALSYLILAESNQPSVRIMQEWILVRIYLGNKQMRDCIWSLFPVGRGNRPGSITSLVSIVYHVAKKMPDDEKLDYIQKAIDQILPSCFSQQFVVRLYSQVVLSKLFEIMGEISTNYTGEYTSIKAAVKESLQYGNLMTNSLKLFDDFYFAVFDPVEDYDLEAIFYEIPRLSNMHMDEWIEPKLFQLLLPHELWESIINVTNRGYLESTEIAQVFKENEDIPELNSVQKQDALADIQKKIIPSTSMLSNTEESAPTAPLSIRQKMVTEDTGLIVIASLIEGFPNLGGLARTAEIFCARELILKSKKYVENKDFQSLSVTAEKWITISEVKPHEIRDYLLEKKSEGWNLVGAEQTANSINLLDMKFNEKTVLLLGNEKNGIPADLIQLMDVCVEIPQAGVVRSLNVHVTGAICMWQYASQHVFKCL